MDKIEDTQDKSKRWEIQWTLYKEKTEMEEKFKIYQNKNYSRSRKKKSRYCWKKLGIGKRQQNVVGKMFK